MASSSSSSTTMTGPSNGCGILLKDRDSFQLQLSRTTSSMNGNGSTGPNLLYKEKEREREKSYSVLSRGRRPSPPPRLPSYSKRHASFDSPREVPLPSPSLSTLSGHHGHSLSQSHVEFGYFDAVAPPRSPKSPRKMTSGTIKEMERDTAVFEEETFEGPHLYDTNGILPPTSQIHPYPRPYSLPHSSSTDECGAGANARRRATGGAEGIHGLENSMSNLNMNRVDRSSSASLPLPAQIPFHTLPRVGDPHKTDVGRLRAVRGNGLSDVAKSRVLELDDADDGDGRTSRSSASESGSSEGTLPSGSPSPPIAQLKADPPLFRSPPSMNASSNPNVPNIHAAYSNHTSSCHSSTATNYSRPLTSTLQSRQAALVEATAHATALRRRPSSNTHPSSMVSSYPPPEPPMILPPPSLPQVALNVNSQQSQNSNSDLPSAPPPPVVVPRITNASDLPPVLPPTSRTSMRSTSSTLGALAAPSSSTGLLRSSSNSSNSSMATSNVNAPPAYAPFLSHMPPPADSWIEVETTPGEYRLNIRLPGFKRDGITLATKRRRILHVVADSWPDPDPNSRVNSTSSTPAANANLSTTDGSSSSATSTGSNTSSTDAAISLNPPSTPAPHPGGHFERRISFGYDADLVGVRAEFDGEMLRIVVPRRQGFAIGGAGVGAAGFGISG